MLVSLLINSKTGKKAPHLVVVNKNQDKETYKCEECHKNFSTFPYLREHMKSHIKPHTCWICDKTFSVMAQLTSHLTNCNKQQKSMHCNICDKTFAFPALYKQHKLTYHPEDRPCREAFQQRPIHMVPAAVQRSLRLRQSLQVSEVQRRHKPKSKKPIFCCEETDVKTEESNAELNNPSPAIMGINPEIVINNVL